MKFPHTVALFPLIGFLALLMAALWLSKELFKALNAAWVAINWLMSWQRYTAPINEPFTPDKAPTAYDAVFSLPTPPPAGLKQSLVEELRAELEAAYKQEEKYLAELSSPANMTFRELRKLASELGIQQKINGHNRSKSELIELITAQQVAH